MGRLIPAGTGLPIYRDVGIQVEVPEGFELETAPAGEALEGEIAGDAFEEVTPAPTPPVAGLFASAPDSTPDGGSVEG